jgi:hypothetical protein
MYLSHHQTATGPRWALEGSYLPQDFTLEGLLETPGAGVRRFRRIWVPKGRPETRSCRRSSLHTRSGPAG